MNTHLATAVYKAVVTRKQPADAAHNAGKEFSYAVKNTLYNVSYILHTPLSLISSFPKPYSARKLTSLPQ